MAKPKLRVVQPDETEVRYTGQLTVLQRLNQYEFAVEIRMMREGINRNKWDYRNLETYATTFHGTPILCAFVNGQIGDGHNMSEKIDGKGNHYYSFTDGTAERIVGTLSDDKEDFSVVEENGEKWLIAKGRLWEFYAPELVDKIIRTGRMDVSVETMVEESYDENGIEVFTKWTGLGVTILGDSVQPAIPNASIKALAELEDEFQEAKMKAASFNEQESKKPNEPKQKNTMKGAKSYMLLNQKAIAELQAKYFPEYAVLAARKADKEVHVCMMAKDGSICKYVMPEGEATIQPERIESVVVNSTIAFENSDPIEIDTYAIIEKEVARNASLTNDLNTANKTIEKLNSDIEAMRKVEDARRLNAAREAAKSALATFNANREDKVDETAIAEVTANIEKNLYTNSVDDQGQWVGDKEVADAVYAVCAKCDIELQAEKAKSKLMTSAWKHFTKGDKKATNSVESLLDSWGISKD